MEESNLEEKQSPEPLISIVLVICRFPHLAVLTLDSIMEQTEQNFEIIVVEQDISDSELEDLQNHAQSKIKTITSCRGMSFSTMKNIGLKVAKGQYVHFLYPGEVYISKFSLSYLKGFLKDNDFPSIACFSYLLRDGISPSIAICQPFSLDFFNEVKIPARLDALWFSREMLNELGGFDERYQYRECFDILCRVFADKKYSVAFARRVLTDYEFHKKTAQEALEFASETIFIIYRNFGVIKTIKWILLQDHFKVLKHCLRKFKNAFIKA
jgi:hypothetical protein